MVGFTCRLYDRFYLIFLRSSGWFILMKVLRFGSTFLNCSIGMYLTFFRLFIRVLIFIFFSFKAFSAAIIVDILL